MPKIYALVLLLFLAFALFPLVYADRGMIPILGGVSVYEPGQKAIVAWNGQEELLILSTDVASSQETLVLEILPLPSKPVVEAASFQSFTKIQDIIWEEGVNQGAYSTKDNARSGSVEILFHQQIGAHNITVVIANDAVSLVDWGNNFLSTSGVNKEVTLQGFHTVVEDYMRRGFRHYAMDLVTFSSEERSIDPILYRFNSSTLYYPLLITSPVGGSGEITLFTLTREKVETDYWPLQPAYYKVSGNPSQPIQFTLSRGDLSKIDLRIGELFPEGAWLNVFRFEGDLGLLNRDLMISEEAFNPTVYPQEVIAANVPYIVIILCFLSGAATALAGVALEFLINRGIDRKQN